MADGSIELVTGTLGGGKTLFTVERGCLHLRAGGYWFTNIEVYPDKIGAWLASEGLKFDPSRLVQLKGDLGTFHEQIARGSDGQLVMVAIDEAHLGFNARDWAKTNRELLDFNTLVRKLDINLLYVTQAAENLDKQFRRLSATTWICRNLRHLKIFGFIPCPLPVMFRVPVDTTRGKGGIGMSPDIKFRRSFAMGLYNSKALLGASAEKIGQMRQVKGAPLERIPRPKTASTSIWPALIATVCAASFAFF